MMPDPLAARIGPIRNPNVCVYRYVVCMCVQYCNGLEWNGMARNVMSCNDMYVYSMCVYT